MDDVKDQSTTGTHLLVLDTATTPQDLFGTGADHGAVDITPAPVLIAPALSTDPLPEIPFTPTPFAPAIDAGDSQTGPLRALLEQPLVSTTDRHGVFSNTIEISQAIAPGDVQVDPVERVHAPTPASDEDGRREAAVRPVADIIALAGGDAPDALDDLDTDSLAVDPASATDMPAAVVAATWTDPTTQTYGPLQHAYAYFNEHLFEGALPGALITLRSDKNSLGYFSKGRFGKGESEQCDEIAMNSHYFGLLQISFILSVLAHEQVHQLQSITGTPGRGRYHNKQFGDYMRAIGLEPSSTGRPGGKVVGDNMAHYIVDGGRFDTVCSALLKSDFSLAWFDRFPPRKALRLVGALRSFPPGAAEALLDAEGEVIDEPERPALELTKTREGVEVKELPGRVFGTEQRPRSKVKFTCPDCKANAWGKPGLLLVCGTDHVAFVSEIAEDTDDVGEVAEG